MNASGTTGAFIKSRIPIDKTSYRLKFGCRRQQEKFGKKRKILLPMNPKKTNIQTHEKPMKNSKVFLKTIPLRIEHPFPSRLKRLPNAPSHAVTPTDAGVAESLDKACKRAFEKQGKTAA